MKVPGLPNVDTDQLQVLMAQMIANAIASGQSGAQFADQVYHIMGQHGAKDARDTPVDDFIRDSKQCNQAWAILAPIEPLFRTFYEQFRARIGQRLNEDRKKF